MHSHESGGNIPGMPPFPDSMPEELREQLRQAHANGEGGLTGLLVRELLGRMTRPDPDEEMRQGIRGAMDADPEETKPRPLRFAISTVVRTDGSEMLLSSAQLQEGSEDKALAETRDFLQVIVRPILKKGETARVRLLDLSFGHMVERAEENWTLPEFEEHVLMLQADSEHEARVAKFEQCEDCEVEGCESRITERPTDDAD